MSASRNELSKRLYLPGRFNDNCGVAEQEQGEALTYNSNRLGHTIVCEGPHPDPYCMHHAFSFLNNLMLRRITHHIAAGDPHDKRDKNAGFLDVTDSKETERLENRGWKFTVREIKLPFATSEAFTYCIIITRPFRSAGYMLHYLTLPLWKDFTAENFNDDTVKMLYVFFHSALTQDETQLGVNCAAGLGRSGVIALAFALYSDPEVSITDETTAEALLPHLFNTLSKFREQRPGLLYQENQQRMAAQLAIRMRLLDPQQENLLTQGKPLIDDVEKAIQARKAIVKAEDFANIFSDDDEYDSTNSDSSSHIETSKVANSSLQTLTANSISLFAPSPSPTKERTISPGALAKSREALTCSAKEVAPGDNRQTLVSSH